MLNLSQKYDEAINYDFCDLLEDEDGTPIYEGVFQDEYQTCLEDSVDLAEFFGWNR